MGMGIDTSSLESQVMQAEQLLQAQNYEQSIQLAGAGMQSARRIYYAAMQQALMRQMAIAAEQRRQSVRMAAPAWNGVSFGAAAATAAAAAILDQTATAAPPVRPRLRAVGYGRRLVVQRHGAGELVIGAHQWNWVRSSATICWLDAALVNPGRHFM